MTDSCGGPGHTHRLPRALLLTLVIICAGLVVSILLVSVQAVRADRQARDTDQRLTALEGFIADRGEERDQQYSTLDERIDRAFCQVFDELPAGEPLDTARKEHGCGPGVPVADLSPEARTNLQRYADGLPLTTDNSPTDPGRDYYATPDPSIPTGPTVDRKQPREPAESPPAAPSPSAAPVAPTATPSPSPLVDLGPVTQPVCDALGVCL